MSQASNVVALATDEALDVGGKTIELLPGGRLANLADWSPAVAEALAGRTGITLGEDHWVVINQMREYYAEYNIAPPRKLLKRALRAAGHESLANDARLDALFPNNVLVQGTRIAGIPESHLDAELERETYATRRPQSSFSAGQPEAIEFEGRRFELTPTGNLVRQAGWNERLAGFLAQREGIELTEAHWTVINFLRDFYFEYGITPMVKILMKHMAEEVGEEYASRDFLYGLFPKGPSRQGSRIAGLPEPQGCIDG
ncbi:TusE/DsrC/DsvC family sulfur relay protein [Thiohalobacter sp. IOR34]|uniref:TusE/DsrC/DsvC family sulfur relay protein n=1 Tax=Thiohalobacter sp. IOR34 TaxID=3057176 RepID=UPI0025B245B7|nr:TusE/DsrC/DsvC family sulfur relay protein [Thiohalobacter sp. IOR34]WJW74373.1 TusE/DsrC/DsvC family sulfur relay protein [Thiohalobacter sp. IOR34]